MLRVHSPEVVVTGTLWPVDELILGAAQARFSTRDQLAVTPDLHLHDPPVSRRDVSADRPAPVELQVSGRGPKGDSGPHLDTLQRATGALEPIFPSDKTRPVASIFSRLDASQQEIAVGVRGCLSDAGEPVRPNRTPFQDYLFVGHGLP